MGRVGREFDDLVRQGIGPGGFSRGIPLAGHGVVAAREEVV